MRIWVLVLWVLMAAGVARADDRDVLTAFLEDNLSGAGRVVTVTGFEGALSSQARIAALTVADGQGVWLTLTGVTLDWNRAALLGGTLEVKRLAAEEITVGRLPVAETASALPQAEAAAFALPQLPVAVVLGDVSAGRIRLGAGVLGQAVEGTLSADGSLVGGQGHLRFELRRTDGVTGLVSMIAVYANDTGILTLAAKAEEAAGGLAVTALGVPGQPAANLVLGGKGPLDRFEATLALETDGAPRLAGKLTTFPAPAQGTAQGGTGFTADLTGDMAPLLAPDYAAFFGPSLALHAEGLRRADGGLDLPALSLRAAALQLQGQVSIAPDGLPQQVALTGRLALAGGGPVLLPLPGTPTRIGSADLDIAYDRARGEDWTARIAAQGLDRADLTAAALNLTVDGNLRHGSTAAVTAQVQMAAQGLKPADPALAQALGPEATARVTLEWQAGSGALALRDLALTAGDVTLTTEGSIGSPAEGLRLDGQVQLRAGDLRRFAGVAGLPLLAGAAEVQMTGWFSPLSGQFDADMTAMTDGLTTGQPQADGLLAGQASLTLSGRRDETGTALRRFTLQSDRGSADLSGQLASAGSALTGTLRLPDLSALALGLSGALEAKAGVTGTLEDGRLTLTGTGRDLAMGQAEADALARGDTRLDLALTRKGEEIGIEQAVLTAPAARVSASGSYAPAGVDITADLALTDLGAVRTGWRGGLSGTVALSGPMDALQAQVQAQSTGLGIGQPLADRLIGGAGELIAALELRGQRLVIQGLDFQNPALTLSASGAPEDMTIAARLANLGLILPEFPGALTAEGSIRQGTGGTALDLRLRGPGQIDGQLAGTLSSDLGQANLTARGTAQAGLANILIAPRVVSGRVGFDLALRGPLALNSLTGRANLTDGRLADPDQPVSLTAMTAEARIAGGAANLTLDSRLTTGGQVTVQGRIGLTPPMPADLSIGLKGAVLRDPDLYSTTLDGALTFQGPALGGAKVAGTITLARTELRIPSTGMSAVPVLSDLHHANEPPPVRATRVRAGLEGASARGAAGGGGYGLDILVRAPNQVFIRGRGLDAELGGQVRLAGTTAAIVPSGALTLNRGRLDLLGKRLVLTEASLQMQGALVPYVRIAATTQSDGFAISAVIEGDALNPNVVFTSSPQLPQEEVIARLLFDKSLQTLSPFQAAQLASAVATLAGKGGEGVIGKLRRQAGLDNLDVQADAAGNTSVTAGKYLSDKVYTEVTVDQTGKSTVTLNLDVARHITLKGSVQDDGQTGIGIYLEKDY